MLHRNYALEEGYVITKVYKTFSYEKKREGLLKEYVESSFITCKLRIPYFIHLRNVKL